ncbi:MAG: hypothetical protein ACXADS_09060 [Candidatus Thorarchaeota archaeon]
MTENQIEPAISRKLVIAINSIVLVVSALAIALSYIRIFPFYDPPGLYRFLPGDILIDFIWVYILTFICGVLAYVAAPFLSAVFWKGHRFLTAGHYKYHVQVFDAEAKQRSRARRLILPAFVALGLATAIANIRQVANLIFVSESFGHLDESAPALEIGLPIFFILILIASFVTLLFVPLWLLEDTGVICEREAVGRRVTADIEGVGNWYLALLKGFAGITTVIAYLFIAVETIEWYYTISVPESFPWIILIVPVVAIVGSPFLAIAPISVVHVCYELSLRRNKERLEQKLARAGLTKVVIDLSRSSESSEME